MSIHKKLMEARIKLQNTKLTKSGHNKFAGYDYFELGDFLPQIQQLFSEIGLCGVISFCKDEATLTISKTDTSVSGGSIEFKCPMAQASLKGCHEVQNLGASMTYIRRYLWVNALEIVEHDALDATTGQEGKGKGVHKPTDNQDFKPDTEELKHLQGILDTILGLDADYEAIAAFLPTQNMDADEKTWVWDKLDSKTRSGIKAVKPKEQK
jgi:hypothetical protein